MKTFLASILVIAGLSFSWLQASIVFSHKEWDFKRIPQREAVRHTFDFRNDGNGPLILSEVKTSCGCTTPDWPKQPIMPGQSAEIIVEYDAQKDGAFDKTINVYTNIQDDPFELKIKGVVYPKSSVEPENEGTELKLD